MKTTCILILCMGIVACGKNGDAGSVSVPVLSPGVVEPPITSPPIVPPVVAPPAPSPFSGRQYVDTQGSAYPVRFCTLGTGNPKWVCNIAAVQGGCPGMTRPTFIKIHADNSIYLWGQFEDSVYNNGKFTLTGSGYTWDMTWRVSNDLSAWTSNMAKWGAVVTFGPDCSQLFYDVGAI